MVSGHEPKQTQKRCQSILKKIGDFDSPEVWEEERYIKSPVLVEKPLKGCVTVASLLTSLSLPLLIYIRENSLFIGCNKAVMRIQAKYTAYNEHSVTLQA